MNLKNGIYFQKINGRKSNGKQLEILVNDIIAEKLLIQPNIGNPQTHVRIIGSNLFDENIAYRLNDPENYTDIIQKIKRTAKIEYDSRHRFSLRKPKIEIRIQ